MSKVRIGVIGVGIGRNHLQNYRECDQADVVAVCDIDLEKLNGVLHEWPGVRGLADYREMLEMEEVQGVSVSLPNYLHAPVTIDALRAGKHVLCEKPMATNVAEAEEMKAVAEREGKILMMRFNMRRFPMYQSIKRLADAGLIGDIYHMAATYTRRDFYPGLGGWFGQKERSGGGPLIDLGVHRLDLALWIAGYPRPVAVMGQTCDLLASEKLADQDVAFDCEDFAAGMVRFENNCTLYLTASWDAHQRERTEQLMRLYGTEGGVFEDAPAGADGGKAYLCRRENGVDLVSAIEPVAVKDTCQSEFVRCIAEGTAPSATAAQGIAVQKILHALYHSARTGKEVCVE